MYYVDVRVYSLTGNAAKSSCLSPLPLCEHRSYRPLLSPPLTATTTTCSRKGWQRCSLRSPLVYRIYIVIYTCTCERVSLYMHQVLRRRSVLDQRTIVRAAVLTKCIYVQIFIIAYHHRTIAASAHVYPTTVVDEFITHKLCVCRTG